MKYFNFQLDPLIPNNQSQPSSSSHPIAIFNPQSTSLAIINTHHHTETQTLTSVSQQAIYLAHSQVLHPDRRSLITRSYEIFSSLHQVANVCEDQDLTSHQTKPTQSTLPSTSRLQYYSRIGDQYTMALREYLIQLEQDEEKNAEEIDLVIQLIEAFSLFVLVHVPSDGLGDSIFAEQLLDWVNRNNPQPPKHEGEELGSLAVPYEHVNFWPYIHACVIRGHLAQATALLVPYTKTSNPTLNQLMTVTIALIRSAPRSTAFAHEQAFTKAVHSFRQQVDQLLNNLDSEMDIISQNERSGSSEEGFDEDELLHFQASFKILLEIMSGDEERVSEACYDWREAVGAHLLWVHPTCRRDGLPSVMRTVTENWPIDETSVADQLSASILLGQIDDLIQQASQLDPWLVCHLVDLLEKIGFETLDRWYFIQSYVQSLSVDQALWRVMIAYLATASTGEEERMGIESIRQVLRRVVMMMVVDDVEKEVMVNKEKASFKVSMVEMKETYEKYGLEDELDRVTRMMSRRLVKQRKYGPAMAYAVASGEVKMISRISDALLQEYLLEGPEEFARLVDELPKTLLHPTAPELRPQLFQTLSTHDGSPSHHCSRLVFVSRYRDMHAYYARGEKKLAAEALVGMLISEIAPRSWWAICLIDSIPLLEDEEILISLGDTYELLRCLEEISGGSAGDDRDLKTLELVLGGERGSGRQQLEVVRYALSRHLGRCLTSRY